MSNESKIEELKQKIIKINNVSPSFCTAKWLQTTLYLQNGYNHSCHHPSPHKIPVEEVVNNPAALHNSSYKKEQRRLMKEGIRPAECDYCWNIEDLGKDYFSDRYYKTSDTWAWDQFDDIANKNPTDDVNPSYLEVSFSNACNFKCAYCSPEISSKWLEEVEKFGSYPTSYGTGNLDWLKSTGRFPYKHRESNPYVDAFWKWFPDVYRSLKVFRITGGEPLMSKDFWKMLDWLIENPNTELDLGINTNLCNDKKLIEKFIEKIKIVETKVKRVFVFTSIESIDQKAEYARFGLKFDQWRKNVDLLLDLTKVDLGIMTTMNILSVHDTTELIKLVIDLRAKYNKSLDDTRIHCSFNILRWPRFLSVKLLSHESKVKLAEDIVKTAKYYTKYEHGTQFSKIYLEELNQLERFCDYMMGSHEEDENILKKDLYLFVNEYDRRKNTNFLKTFPELEQDYNYWSTL